MPRRDPIVAAITLFLLNVFTVSAAGAVVKLTPQRELEPRAAAVADRSLVQAGNLADDVAAAAPLPGSGTLAAKLSGLLTANVNAVVVDAVTRRSLFDQRGGVGAVPASTTKLATSTAVLSALGPDHRLTTKVVRSAAGIVLVGGGDPTLAGPSAQLTGVYPRPASLVDLARQTVAALKKAGTTHVRLDYDTSLFQSVRSAQGWKPNYQTDGETAEVSALTIDEGRVVPGTIEAAQRVPDPPAAAAKAFGQLLQQYGITVQKGTKVTAAASAPQLAAVQSPTIADLVEKLLTNSDNDLAEAMARQVAVKLHLTADFNGGAQGVHQVLAGLGLAQGVQTYDGSGLSTKNRITPVALARLISAAASSAHPELRAVITGMPVAGFSGTLAGRYLTAGTQGGAGYVRAKTGTLDQVNTLAGLAYDSDGRLLAFAFMANKVADPAAALSTLDRLATVLTTCGCH
jgi:D-alanyl-D-alanine carboxypeptidase